MNATESYLNTVIANLTSEPGVYRMLDHEKTVLYVGKAGNLKKRVSSYFSKKMTGAKTRSLVSQIAAIEVTITRSETEALLLESNLIKTLRPKYNVLMRDDKSYPYIHLTSNHTFARMELFRSKKKPKQGDYFGPFPSATAVRETLNAIQKVFKIRSCRDSYFNARSRPCLQYQIKRCTAPCTGYITADLYQQAVKNAVSFLQGKSQLILNDLAKRMDKASTNLDFEEAAILRDQIKSLRLIQESQGMVQLRGEADIIAIEARPGFACVQCVTVRGGQVIASKSFFPTVPLTQFIEEEVEQQLYQQVFTSFVSFYYVEVPERIPAAIVIAQPLADRPVIEEMLTKLRGKRCVLQIAPRGVKARWLDFTTNNLQLAIAEQRASSSAIQTRYTALSKFLGLETGIKRMECFDISHTQGEAAVASCVVFDDKGAKKSDYRRFNITGITAGDDYAAMRQAISRRFKKLLQEHDLPDLLIIDGGKGQVSSAKQVLNELGVTSVTLIGIAKGPERKAGWEKIILAAQDKQLTLPADSPALHLLQHIRDEAHRFAIKAHRNKRSNSRLTSSLESIEGVGVKRRQALLQRFGGLRELAKAPLDEIIKVPGINAELAARIYYYFHSNQF